MADIYVLPVQRKRGRRRLHSVPGAAAATVLNLNVSTSQETPDQKLARIDDAMYRMAHALLTAIRVAREVVKIVDPNSPLGD